MKKLEKQLKDFREIIQETNLIPELIKTRLIARIDEAERHLPRKPTK